MKSSVIYLLKQTDYNGTDMDDHFLFRQSSKCMHKLTYIILEKHTVT